MADVVFISWFADASRSAVAAAQPYVQQAKEVVGQVTGVAADKARELGSIAQAQGGDTLRWAHNVIRSHRLSHTWLQVHTTCQVIRSLPPHNQTSCLKCAYHSCLQFLRAALLFVGCRRALRSSRSGFLCAYLALCAGLLATLLRPMYFLPAYGILSKSILDMRSVCSGRQECASKGVTSVQTKALT